MTAFLAAKGPDETVQRRWSVPVDSNDGAASITATGSDVTVEASLEGDEAVFALSGGTAGTTATIAVSVTTSQGRVLVETLYLPVVSPDSSAATVADVIAFALRKVTGSGETPNAEQAADALERLTDMLEVWRMSGADVGATRPLLSSSVLYCPESYLSAIKNNLIMQVADLYTAEISPVVVQNARIGLAHIKARNLPRVEPSFY